jgi:NAD(P)-dependent dehydrogenase (short-subunit alcohol dehydrogenase family)
MMSEVEVANAAYIASKWAVGGFAETIALEVASFGVKVTALEPGGMRTNWGKRAFGTCLPCCRIMKPRLGKQFGNLKHIGAMNQAIPKRSRKSSSASLKPIVCRLTSCSAQTYSREHLELTQREMLRLSGGGP